MAEHDFLFCYALFCDKKWCTGTVSSSNSLYCLLSAISSLHSSYCITQVGRIPCLIPNLVTNASVLLPPISNWMDFANVVAKRLLKDDARSRLQCCTVNLTPGTKIRKYNPYISFESEGLPLVTSFLDRKHPKTLYWPTSSYDNCPRAFDSRELKLCIAKQARYSLFSRLHTSRIDLT